MPDSKFVYNGSTTCRLCGNLLSPLQSMYSDLCPKCNRAERRKLLRDKMAGA